MELLPLLLVLLAGTLATSTPLLWWDLDYPTKIALDMAPNSFDDQYRGCKQKMMQKLHVINSTESSTNAAHALVWAHAKAIWLSRPYLHSWLPQHEGIALLAYSMNSDLYRQFNAATREGGRSRQYYRHKYHYKVMHFLITKAVRDLRKAKTHPHCLHVYRGIHDVQFTAKPGQIIRFGQFTSSSQKKEVALKFGNDTFFEVDTCHAASIRHFSVKPPQYEVLIPPFETFRVLSVTYHGNKPQIRLKSQGVHSKYNCEWLRGPHTGRILWKAPALEEPTSTP